MRRLTLTVMLAAAATFASFSMGSKAEAGYPVYYAPAAPTAVVGYSARRAGLFGRRVIVRPVVAPIAPVVAAPVVVARPVVTAYPPAPPVSAYYAPAPVAVPVPAYAYPYRTYYPFW